MTEQAPPAEPTAGVKPTAAEIRDEQNATRKAILAAMRRLVDGESQQSFTVLGLAREAGINRAQLTTGAHRDLGRRMQALIADSLEPKSPKERELQARLDRAEEAVSEMRSKYDALKAERDDWEDTAKTVARAAQVLHLENNNLRSLLTARQKQLDRLQAIPRIG